MNDRIRVALVQAESCVGHRTFDPRDANLERALTHVRRAAEEGADLVLFGEMYLSGYRTDEFLPRYASEVSPPDRHVTALVEAARSHRVHIIIGAATFGSGVPGDVYNSALVVGPEDGLIGVYRKTHVAAFAYSKGISMERCFYSPGRELPVFNTRLGRIGVHICYDISFPEVSRVQVLKGADLLVNVSASAEGFETFWDHLLFARAVENATWYVMCSVVGEQRGDRLFGGSRVITPTGEVVVAGKYNEPDFLIADIDLRTNRVVRSTSHLLSTRQPDLYAPLAEATPYP